MIKKMFIKIFIMAITLPLSSMDQNHWCSKDIAAIQEVETKDTRALTTPDYYLTINRAQKEIMIKQNIFSSKRLKPITIKQNHPSYFSILQAIEKIKIIEVGNTNTVGLTTFTFYSCSKSDLETLNEAIETLN